jgi:cytochrome b6-f complex iron-sulfur subunit
LEAEAESAGGAPATPPPAAATPAAAPAATPPARSILVDTPIAKPVPKRGVITRRIFILGGFWSAVGLLLVGLVGAPLDFMWIRKVRGFGGPIAVTPDRIPPAGADPLRIIEGKFWLLNLEPGTTTTGAETPGGVLALWQKCPHLGCTVPYRPAFEFEGRRGWFRCPCHNSTYTKEGGVLVFGPAPRSMDVFPIEVQADGGLIVQTGREFDGTGSSQNPTRAIPLEPGNITPPPA